MEESEKRKERLKAMRTEAAQGGVNADSENTASHGLSNPLVEIETTLTAPSPRFDYYTHPMSAFSGNKRQNPLSTQVARRHQFTPQRPMYQWTNPPPPYHNPALNSPHQNMMHYNLGSVRSPMGPPQRYPPNAWGGPGASSFHYRHSQDFVQGHYPSSGFGQGVSPNTSNYGRGRGRGYSNNNYHHGPGHGYNQYPDSRRGGGRSFGRRGGEFGFNKMVEDPWKFLSPVIWKHSEASWMPKSIQSKKAKVTPETSDKPTSKRLAEYLALAFSESATDEAAAQELST